MHNVRIRPEDHTKRGWFPCLILCWEGLLSQITNHDNGHRGLERGSLGYSENHTGLKLVCYLVNPKHSFGSQKPKQKLETSAPARPTIPPSHRSPPEAFRHSGGKTPPQSAGVLDLRKTQKFHGEKSSGRLLRNRRGMRIGMSRFWEIPKGNHELDGF